MSFAHEAGKGSRQRPTDKKKYDDNWDRIFGKEEVWIYPPSGWLYGFPAVWDRSVSLDQFLKDKGYPENYISFAITFLRMWKKDENNK